MKVTSVVLLALVMVECVQALLNQTETSVPAANNTESHPFVSNGSVASARKQPYLVGVIVNLPTGSFSICGASMLSNTRSVTAAHCWKNRNYEARKFILVFGANNIYTEGTRVNSKNVEVHPDYNMRNLNNDIAMITHKHVDYSETIQPIALPSDDLLDNDFAGWWAAAVGFGATSDDPSGKQNDKRYVVIIEVISNEVCARSFRRSAIVNSTLCIDTTGGHSTCPGDSGGPLVTQRNAQQFLIGITSFGVHHCERENPAAFTRVTSFVPWIREKLMDLNKTNDTE